MEKQEVSQGQTQIESTAQSVPEDIRAGRNTEPKDQRPAPPPPPPKPQK